MSRRPEPTATVKGPMDTHICRRIWRMALLQAVRDLCTVGTSAATPSLRTAVERWIGLWPSRDFRTVCELAGIDFRRVHAALRQLADIPPESRRAAWFAAARTENTSEPGRKTMQKADYRAVAPIRTDNERTRYIHIGAMSEKTSKDGEIYYRLKLDVPIVVTEVLMFPPRVASKDGAEAR